MFLAASFLVLILGTAAIYWNHVLGMRPDRNLPVWLHPGVLAALAGGVPLVLALVVRDETYRHLWRSHKYFRPHHFAIGAALLSTFVLGTILASRGASRVGKPLTSQSANLLGRCGRLLFNLTIIGYLAIFTFAAGRGLTSDSAIAAVAGQSGQLANVKHVYLAPVAGVTTLTQFGPLAVVALLLAASGGSKRGTRWRVGLLFVLALIRSVLHAERLALIEIAMPAFVIWLMVSVRGQRYRLIRRRVFISTFPLWAPVLLLVVFGTFEYGRSWSSYYKYVEPPGTTYSGFVSGRLEGYYATAANNAALLLDDFRGGVRVPYYTLQGLWEFPGVNAIADYPELNGLDVKAAWRDELTRKANPEFNNEGGFIPVVADYGFLGAGLWWAVMGLAIGHAYSRFRRGSVIGLLTYPLLVTGLFEIGRFTYWTLGRALPALVGAFIVHMYVRRRSLARVESIQLKGGINAATG